jgi:hypothetical protein
MAEGKGETLVVMTMEGRSCILPLDTRTTVMDLKIAASEKLGIPASIMEWAVETGRQDYLKDGEPGSVCGDQVTCLVVEKQCIWDKSLLGDGVFSCHIDTFEVDLESMIHADNQAVFDCTAESTCNFPVRSSKFGETRKHTWRVLIEGSSGTFIGAACGGRSFDPNKAFAANTGCWGMNITMGGEEYDLTTGKRSVYFAGARSERVLGPKHFTNPCVAEVAIDCDNGTLSVNVEGQFNFGECFLTLSLSF